MADKGGMGKGNSSINPQNKEDLSFRLSEILKGLVVVEYWE